eukprot:2855649-Ditylum_brightwellii.AAC.1
MTVAKDIEQYENYDEDDRSMSEIKELVDINGRELDHQSFYDKSFKIEVSIQLGDGMAIGK